MQSTLSKRALRRRLHRAGLSRAYVARVIRELEDHSEDLGQRPGAEKLACRLGVSCGLADAFVEHYRNRFLCGRQPWIAFVLSPAIVALVLVAVFLALSIPLQLALLEAVQADKEMIARMLRALALVGVRGIPAMTAAAFAWLAVRICFGVRGIWSSGLVLALLGAALQCGVDAPVPGRTAGELVLDLNLLQPNLAGLLPPLGLALAFTWSDARKRRTEAGGLHT